MSETKPYLTTRDVARLLMVTPATVRNWAEHDGLAATSTVGGHRRYQRREVEAFARANGLMVADGGSGPLRILIADDDDRFARYVVEVLRAAPVASEVERASNGFEAGSLVRTFRPDVLLLDLRMPGADGLRVCAQLKSDPQTRGLRVIAMSGLHAPGVREQVVEAGAETLLVKPFEPEGLLEAIGLTGKV